MPSIAIIIPCYNEAARLKGDEFIQAIQQQADSTFFFVNDGSTDDTAAVLSGLQQKEPNRIHLLSLPRNSGKGEAVRQGLLAALQYSFDYAGYLDADGATPVHEFFRLYRIAIENNASVVFASRIKKLDSFIERSYLRHAAGRIIATIIDSRFRLGCYDTQCGAKIFTTTVLATVIQQPFYTKWFFDMELFLRIKKTHISPKAMEIPLQIWQNRKGSKLRLTSFPLIVKELAVLLHNY